MSSAVLPPSPPSSAPPPAQFPFYPYHRQSTMSQPSASGSKSTIDTQSTVKWHKHATAILFFPTFDGKVLASGDRLGLPGHKIKATLGVVSSTPHSPHLGFHLHFPCQAGKSSVQYTCMCSSIKPFVELLANCTSTHTQTIPGQKLLSKPRLMCSPSDSLPTLPLERRP